MLFVLLWHFGEKPKRAQQRGRKSPFVGGFGVYRPPNQIRALRLPYLVGAAAQSGAGGRKKPPKKAPHTRTPAAKCTAHDIVTLKLRIINIFSGRLIFFHLPLKGGQRVSPRNMHKGRKSPCPYCYGVGA